MRRSGSGTDVLDERPPELGPVAAPPNLAAFGARDWLLLVGTAGTWGSSFVFIEVALEAFAPTFITLLRLLFGVSALVFIKQARVPIARDDLRAVALLGLLWMAIPFILFPVAQQWISSSMAGMINGGVPIFAALVAALFMRTPPTVKTWIGIAIGFTGVVAVSWPAVQGGKASLFGALLVVLAILCYGVAVNLAVPLQQRYGSLPVLLRAQLFAVAFVLIPGLFGAANSSFSWTSLGAVVPLGCLGTGLAFVWMSSLIGRVGAVRASVTVYFVPVVAILLGGIFRNESIALISLLGTALVLGGAFLASRAQASR